MKTLLALSVGMLTCATASAQQIRLTPSVDARLRYEHVDQHGLADAAEAVTLRVRPGVTASHGAWSALVEGEGVAVLVDDYHDGTNGKSRFPLVADPGNVELNRAQIRYAREGAGSLTAGRQRVALVDERFVGPAAWRQSEQTFDAARIQLGKPTGLSADVTYSWNVRTVNGRNGMGGRPQSIGGDNVFALLNYGFEAGTLTAFAYLVDQDEAAVQGFRLSSQTYGLRFAGSMPLAADMKLGYVGSWARQSGWRRNPNDYAATYWLGEASLSTRALTATAGYEVLGADDGRPLTSVQTPLASSFKWNGWAGKFGTTPPDGLRDLYGTLGYGWKAAGPFDALNLGATWHRFDSDRNNLRYGDELDLLASARAGKILLSARYAHYEARAFATDTNKYWLQFDWAL